VAFGPFLPAQGLTGWFQPIALVLRLLVLEFGVGVPDGHCASNGPRAGPRGDPVHRKTAAGATSPVPETGLADVALSRSRNLLASASVGKAWLQPRRISKGRRLPAGCSMTDALPARFKSCRCRPPVRSRRRSSAGLEDLRPQAAALETNRFRVSKRGWWAAAAGLDGQAAESQPLSF